MKFVRAMYMHASITRKRFYKSYTYMYKNYEMFVLGKNLNETN